MRLGFWESCCCNTWY